jgi:hypothetical protein
VYTPWSLCLRSRPLPGSEACVHFPVTLLARLENINEMGFEFQWKYQKWGYRNFLQRPFFGESLAVVTQLMLDLQDLLQFGAS